MYWKVRGFRFRITGVLGYGSVAMVFEFFLGVLVGSCVSGDGFGLRTVPMGV